MASITEEELTRAIEQTLVAHGKIPIAEARPTAQTILQYFGTDDSILDNQLSNEDRDRFYLLEEEGLLTSEEEEATVPQGKTWRIHYWLLKKGRIRSAATPPAAAPESETDGVYSAIGDNEWRRRTG
ncbi:hypothetical protein B1B_15934, partial [mine drainage metagenome]